MPGANAVWGLEIGQCALKAVKVRPSGDGQFELLAFDMIEHPKILSQPDAEPDEIIRAAIEKFASRNDWQRDPIVLGVPGQQTFQRFCKLPRVEPKKVPDIVRFEASQQIPFDMDDVVWDYEVFSDANATETDVGIFAMRKDLVRKQIEYLAHAGMSPAVIQTIPSALYNFARFEWAPEEEDKAVVLVDVGAQNTDLIVVESGGAWMRTIPRGGNDFTDALIKAFKLSFAKAENLKRTAATSKYARQIFQAMRPVFADLVAEIQRSLGYYASTHRDVELSRVYAMGNAFRLPGLQKYLEQNLTVAGGVERLESFKTLVPTATLNAPQFSENILSFGAAYGLALQGLGAARISANLLPTELARVAAWQRKTPFWIGAAAVLLIGAISPWTRESLDASALGADNSPELNDARRIYQTVQSATQRYRAASGAVPADRPKIDEFLELQSQKLLVPHVIELVHKALPQDQRLATAQTHDEFIQLIKSRPDLGRTERKQFILDAVEVTYTGNLDQFGETQVPGLGGGGGGGFGQPGGGRGGPPPGMYGGGGGAAGPPPGMYGGGGPGRGRGPGPAMTTPTEGDTSNPGFYVLLRGRLTYGGDSRAAALQVITEELYKNLQNPALTEGYSFYVLSDEPGQRPRYFKAPELQKFGGTTENLGRPGGGAESAGVDPAYIDPATGEDMSTDWVFEFGFKVKLGERPETPSTE